ncbi:parafibromin [Trypanosoma theileri]|uniref:Parafibromin n=1 Tax=Trypanosoma theileri TaxID=67003 RepID=A0A1X0P358_9TRYP|nr:parafibromin [Trypanosoma theileri]ORC91386.1 parafibromin [Trypanosoma theileri]
MSLREEWGRLVESVAAMNSTDALPRDFTPAEFLPEGREVPAELLREVRANAAAFDAAARALYRPQMTLEEGFHAAPTPSQSRGAEEDGTGGRQNNNTTTTNNNNNNNNNNTNNNNNNNGNNGGLMSEEGPNFFEAYQTHAVAKGNTDSTATVPFGSTASGVGVSGVPRAFGSTARLAAGFLLPEYYAQTHRQPDFIPIILVPSSVSSILQLFNIREFLEKGVYIDPPSLFVDAETGAVNVQENKPDAVIVTPGSFLDPQKYTVAYKVFRVVDDPKQVKNWQHVCACIVDGHEWQFRGWFPNEPTAVPVSELFQRVCGFLPYFEEEKLPKALQEWNVKPLSLTRRVVKAHAHILQASVFWEHLYTFLETHPFFKLYTVPLD